MSDTDFLLKVLRDGRWHSHSEILAASFAERGCGLTIHSRAADLRKRGNTIETRIDRTSSRAVSFYRLVGVLSEAAVETLDSATPSHQYPSHTPVATDDPSGIGTRAAASDSTNDESILTLFDPVAV